MKKNYFNTFKCTMLILFLSVTASIAQNTDSLKYHELLIIPFNPEMYLSDSEQDIMRETKKSPDVYREYFRKVLSLKIAAELETVIPCVSLIQDTDAVAMEDILRFYGQAGYSYMEPINSKAAKPAEASKKGKKQSDPYTQHDAPKYITTKGDSKFMNAAISDTAGISAMAKRYGTDLILSINQFEILTNYNSCIDIANKIYKRELIIHYTLMQPNGKILAGNYVVAFFPSNTNRDTDIIERTFPEIAKLLKEQLKADLLTKK